MKAYTNRNSWMGGILPPFRLLLTSSLLAILLITAPRVAAQSPVNVPLPTMQFHTGTADLADLDQVPDKVAEILRQFHVLEPMIKDPFREYDNYVVHVHIRTDRSESENNRSSLCIARAEAIRRLLLKTTDSPTDPLLELDEIRIHSSIAYRNEPTGVWFEIQPHREKLTQIQLPDSLLTQFTGR